MRTYQDYRTRKTDVVITAFAIIGLGWLLSQPLFSEPQAAAPIPKPAPLSKRLGCEDWKPGKSRTFTFTATEDEAGNLVGAPVCNRYRMGKQKVAL